jgi:acetyl esterase/lipase
LIHKTIELWEKGTYQSEGTDGFRPTLDTYILDGIKQRGAVLICPGGGYGFTSKREAEPIAMQFNAAGFHAFVLYYSVAPRRHPQPLLDISRAMCIIRENVEEWHTDSNKIAVCGFSAGGHLAACLGVHWKQSYIQNAQGIKASMNRPNALILCYPVITSGQYAHRGSFDNLLGEEPKKELLLEMSLEDQINANTPPAFIWHTFNDNSVPVENSLFFATKMRSQGIPFELHIYPEGPHGLSLATAETDEGNKGTHQHVATWMKLCTEWLGKLFENGA